MLDYESSYEKQGYKYIIGIDEAGRGPLAGPVVAAAVILKNSNFTHKIKDSKKMTARQRELAFHEILDKATIGVGIVSEIVIDSKNILEATFDAMHNALLQLLYRIPLDKNNPSEMSDLVMVLVDGNQYKSQLPVSYETITKGDNQVKSIACASIVAKVIRDRIICVYDKIFPEYEFKSHKGYGTQKHKEALRKYGRSPIHRKTFKY